jgi:hypothetical protein
MRCLSHRIIKIHRQFTSAYLLCDKASLINWSSPHPTKENIFILVSTHGLDPTGLKWRCREIARIIHEKSFVRDMEAAMTPQLGSEPWVKHDTVPGFTFVSAVQKTRLTMLVAQSLTPKTLKEVDKQPRLSSPCACLVTSPWHCLRVFGWNCSDVQVANAEAPWFVWRPAH